jgi:hypothetical protein
MSRGRVNLSAGGALTALAAVLATGRRVPTEFQIYAIYAGRGKEEPENSHSTVCTYLCVLRKRMAEYGIVIPRCETGEGVKLTKEDAAKLREFLRQRGIGAPGNRSHKALASLLREAADLLHPEVKTKATGSDERRAGINAS